MAKKKDSGQPEEKKAEKPEEEQKVFKAKSMTDGDLRMPKALRAKIPWLKSHTDVTIEIITLGNDSITLEIHKTKNTT